MKKCKAFEECCKGCYVYTKYTNCYLEPSIKERKCPCITCLVKGICNRPCHLFYVYNKFYKLNKYKWHKEDLSNLKGLLNN